MLSINGASYRKKNTEDKAFQAQGLEIPATLIRVKKNPLNTKFAGSAERHFTAETQRARRKTN
jgi:hypothetical protein